MIYPIVSVTITLRLSREESALLRKYKPGQDLRRLFGKSIFLGQDIEPGIVTLRAEQTVPLTYTSSDGHRMAEDLLKLVQAKLDALVKRQ